MFYIFVHVCYTIWCLVFFLEKTDNQDSITSDLDPILIGEIREKEADQLSYLPVGQSWCAATCSKLGFHQVTDAGVNEASTHYGKTFHWKTEPTKTQAIVGDGNCLFRAVSKAISGSEDNHKELRHLTVMHIMEMNNNDFKQFTGKDAETYLKESNMNEPGVWATDIEIHVLARLLQVPIFVFLKVAERGNWVPHYNQSKTDYPITHHGESIYLLNNGNQHFELVVAFDLSSM